MHGCVNTVEERLCHGISHYLGQREQHIDTDVMDHFTYRWKEPP